MYNENATRVMIEDYRKSEKSVSFEQIKNRNEVQEELNNSAIDKLSYEIFSKSQEEKELLKKLKETAPKGRKYKTLNFYEFKEAFRNKN